MAKLTLTNRHVICLRELAGYLAFLGKALGKETGEYMEACQGGAALIEQGLEEKRERVTDPDALPTTEDPDHEI